MAGKNRKFKSPERGTILYGINSVAERLRKDPASIKKIFLRNNFKNPKIEKLLKNSKAAACRVSESKLDGIKDISNHQGIIALARPFSYRDFESLLERKELIVFLDRINDPQNLGGIIRTAACLGGVSLVIPKHKSCLITDSVLHVASGGENYVAVSLVSNIVNSLLEAKRQGYWVAGAVAKGGADIKKSDLSFPLCVVMGSEGEGIRYGIDKYLDFRVSIPMQGAPLSFNVNVAFAIFCYEILNIRAD
ncbi:MAG: 23S rRNA (guanosine(2251)-2'-O)-methyltransferase RlmB [Candidatus Omnitrophica bacterium]|nr:23S rRNA (guanosine(2251)-2'-O)-methyltransferase RlmB [Candidatus Omnitrophota bacterium]MBD3268877.1 23S rRNA (guanosine(2251)-2'-O)-methyltransferase RlmB [Candidatus Omnitrophota bacterium]